MTTEQQPATMKIELLPFTVPNFVLKKPRPTTRQQGFKPTEPIPISEVPKETLETMCADFRAEIMRKAGHRP